MFFIGSRTSTRRYAKLKTEILQSKHLYFITFLFTCNQLINVFYSEAKLCIKISFFFRLKNTKVDIDIIPIRLLKKIINYIAEPLTYIINKCFTLGTFPDQLKIARVTPVFKKGEHTNSSNYRPISSLRYM